MKEGDHDPPGIGNGGQGTGSGNELSVCQNPPRKLAWPVACGRVRSVDVGRELGR
jgi:hypothetical protein